MASILALWLLAVGGCATTGGSAEGESAADQAAGDRAEASDGGGDEASESGDKGSASEQKPPEGFSDADVMNVFTTASGSAVALTRDGADQVVPIFISQSQAMAIKLRLERRRYTRPLTHDLLDNIVEELDGEISKVHIDAVKSGVFVGTVFVETPDRTFEFDARSSDAIALAVGNQVPIFVADGVFEEAGVPKQKFENRGFGGGRKRMPSPEEEEPKEGESEGEGEGSEEGKSSEEEEGPYF